MPVPPNGPTVGTDTAYGYDIQNDFPNHQVNDDTLSVQIEMSGLPGFAGIIDIHPVCNIYFTAALSPADKTKLDQLVAQHTGEATATSPDAPSMVGFTNDVGQTVALVLTVQQDTQMTIDVTAQARCTKPAAGPGNAVAGDAFSTENTYLVKNVGGVVSVVVTLAASRPPFAANDPTQAGNTLSVATGAGTVSFIGTQGGAPQNSGAQLYWQISADAKPL